MSKHSKAEIEAAKLRRELVAGIEADSKSINKVISDIGAAVNGTRRPRRAPKAAEAAPTVEATPKIGWLQSLGNFFKGLNKAVQEGKIWKYLSNTEFRNTVIRNVKSAALKSAKVENHATPPITPNAKRTGRLRAQETELGDQSHPLTNRRQIAVNTSRSQRKQGTGRRR